MADTLLYQQQLTRSIGLQQTATINIISVTASQSSRQAFPMHCKPKIRHSCVSWPYETHVKYWYTRVASMFPLPYSHTLG